MLAKEFYDCTYQKKLYTYVSTVLCITIFKNDACKEVSMISALLTFATLFIELTCGCVGIRRGGRNGCSNSRERQ